MRSFNNNNGSSPLDYIGVRWGWFLVLGIILLIIGFVAAGYTLFATVAGTMFIGFMMIFGGIAQIVQAFSVSGWGQFFLWLLAGILYLLAGFVCFSNPFAAAAVLTFVLAFFLIVAGITRIIIGIKCRGIAGAGWIVFAGLITGLLGIVLVSGWPANSLWVIGLFVAIDLIFQGWGWIAFSFGLKRVQAHYD